MRTNGLIRENEGNTWGGFALLVVGCVALLAVGGCQEAKNLASQTQPPVQVTLTSFLLLKGYYVNVSNTSTSTTIQGAVVTYTGASGNTKTQTIGTLRPGETKTLDPSEVGWRVEKHESISVSANGYLSKTLQTNILIDQQ